MKEFLKKVFDKNKIKERLPYAVLGSVTTSFMILFFGILEIFGTNRDEFLFSVRDFFGYILLLALCGTLLLMALILLLPDKAARVVFGVTVWIPVTGIIQVLFLNGARSLAGDTGQNSNLLLTVIDTVVWIVTGTIIIAGVFIMRKKEGLKKVYILVLIALLVMQMTSCATQIGNITRDSAERTDEPYDTEDSETVPEETFDPETIATIPPIDPVTTEEDDTTEPVTTEPETTEPETSEPVTTQPETTAPATTAPVTTEPVTTAPATTAPVTTAPEDDEDYSKAYLTKKGLDQVSERKNIVIFLIDRFDVSYYNTIMEKDPSYFDDLDGFTYFGDNVSLYSRTWPAVPTMITGVDNDFSQTAVKYFEKAYTESAFLQDLRDNDFKIKIYTQSYYCYREGTPLVGVADNISVARGYTIKNTGALVNNLVALSAYRYAPNALKSAINISSASFSGIVELNGAAPLYEINDPVVCGQIMKNGLSFDGNDNSYTFIHLNGCHSPYNMDENAREVKEASSTEQLMGCFKMIRFYISEMKRLGVYDNATIVITGDHPRARDDEKVPSQPRLTSLFVKSAGESGTPLQHSSAQVSQDNLIPTLIKSAGIRTDRDYGRSYFEIEEGETTVRYHKFELSDSPSNQIVVFEVKGKGTDFDNWKIIARNNLPGSFYR
ncbi:MAG: hypothetical protein J5879_00150 [Clostridia bacterium]|nr:hypothetical protein [Clostridia bacterium]